MRMRPSDPWAWYPAIMTVAFRAPEIGLEMMTDSACIAHATGGDDDEEAGQPVDRLALFHCLGESHVPRIQGLPQHVAAFDLAGMPLENGAGACRQRRIDEDRRRRDARRSA